MKTQIIYHTPNGKTLTYTVVGYEFKENNMIQFYDQKDHTTYILPCNNISIVITNS